jgi:hypothetical protein
MTVPYLKLKLALYSLLTLMVFIFIGVIVYISIESFSSKNTNSDSQAGKLVATVAAPSISDSSLVSELPAWNFKEYIDISIYTDLLGYYIDEKMITGLLYLNEQKAFQLIGSTKQNNLNDTYIWSGNILDFQVFVGFSPNLYLLLNDKKFDLNVQNEGYANSTLSCSVPLILIDNSFLFFMIPLLQNSNLIMYIYSVNDNEIALFQNDSLGTNVVALSFCSFQNGMFVLLGKNSNESFSIVKISYSEKSKNFISEVIVSHVTTNLKMTCSEIGDKVFVLSPEGKIVCYSYNNYIWSKVEFGSEGNNSSLNYSAGILLAQKGNNDLQVFSNYLINEDLSSIQEGMTLAITSKSYDNGKNYLKIDTTNKIGTLIIPSQYPYKFNKYEWNIS